VLEIVDRARDLVGLAAQVALGLGAGTEARQQQGAETGQEQRRDDGADDQQRDAACHSSRYPIPRTVASGSASPNFLRSWRTWTSTVRSSPYQSAPHAPSSSCWRLSAWPWWAARNASRSNSR